jgi:hypothetical protein
VYQASVKALSLDPTLGQHAQSVFALGSTKQILREQLANSGRAGSNRSDFRRDLLTLS